MELFKFEFNYEYLDTINSFLKDSKIRLKSFKSDKVEYYIEFDGDIDFNTINMLKLSTFNQIKITHIFNEVEEMEKGTDKPLGSKSAIDEN